MKICIHLLILACFTACQQSTPDGSQPIPSNPLVMSDGVKIAYDLCGQGQATVVLIHGWCIDRSYWSRQQEALCEKYQTLTLDLPGHGESGSNRDQWTVEQFGKDVSTLIDQLELDNLVLVGHSMGGDVMLETAFLQKDKIKGIIGIDTFKDTGHIPDSTEQAGIDGFMQYIRSDFKGAADVFAGQFLFSEQTDSLSRTRILKSIKSADTTRAVTILESIFDYSPKEIPQLKALGHKLYLINSDVTPTLETHFMEAGIEFEVIDIQGTGHYPMIEKPEVFTNLLMTTVGRIIEQKP